MHTSRSNIILILSILITLSLACTLTGSEAAPVQVSEDAIATSVAATLAAGAEDTPPTLAVDPTITASPPEPDIVFQGTSFTFGPSLADSVNAENMSEDSEGSEMWAIPDHIQFTFNNFNPGDAFHNPAIRIFSVEKYRAVNPNVGDSLDKLKAAVDSQNVHSEDILVPEFTGAAQYFKSLVQVVNFQNGSGFRYISQYGQAAWPIGFPNMFYAFQGFTDDGNYYISAIFPISHSSLPHPDDVVMNDAFYDNFMNYSADTQMHLDLQDAETFEPSLTLLDELVESLLVESP